MSSQKISFFKKPISNIFPFNSKSLREVYELIRSSRYQEVTKILRVIPDLKQARKYKAEKFDYLTFSGAFVKRSDQNLITHSGFLCLDFDHLENLSAFRKFLLEDDSIETELLFVSPSGDGLKWVVAVDLQVGSHLEWFQGISNYIEASYGVQTDSSGKDVSRACFIPHDPDVYINPKYLK